MYCYTIIDNSANTPCKKKQAPEVLNTARIIRYSISWEDFTCIPPSLHSGWCFKIIWDFYTLSSVMLPDRISTWRDTASTILFLLESLSSSSTRRNYLTFCISLLKHKQISTHQMQIYFHMPVQTKIIYFIIWIVKNYTFRVTAPNY